MALSGTISRIINGLESVPLVPTQVGTLSFKGVAPVPCEPFLLPPSSVTNTSLLSITFTGSLSVSPVYCR